MNILEARRRMLGAGVYKKTVTGNPAIAQGSLARRYPGITMQGWTEQDGTPTPEAPVPIVSAGTQNQDTGKWEYEITIANEQTDPGKNQTVLLTSDRPLTKWDRLEKRNGQWGWVYKSEVKSLPKTGFNVSGRDNNNGVYYINELPLSEYDTKIGNVANHEQYFNFFVNENPYNHVGNYAWLYRGITAGVVQFRIGLQDDSIVSVQELEEYLSELGEIIVVYETAEETFTPLTASEQEQMNELYTFRPTTVLSNDCNCNMTLTYKTKKSLEVTT